LNRSGRRPVLRVISFYILLAAAILAIIEGVRFSYSRTHYPPGTRIAGVPVAGLDRQKSTQRLIEIFNQPVEIHYREAIIHLDPAGIGFQLDLLGMLAAADQAYSRQPFWVDYWHYLWEKSEYSIDIPLQASYPESRLQAFLVDIKHRYSTTPRPAMPAVGTVSFYPGYPGFSFDLDSAIPLIDRALRSPSARIVELGLTKSAPSRPSYPNLAIFLKQTILQSKFDGLIVLYLRDLQTTDEIHFAYRAGKDLATRPDVAFSASNMIQLPIMVSVFRRVGDNLDQDTAELMEQMMIKSRYQSADLLMKRKISAWRAPLDITADMRLLGLNNTFLGGYFSPGSPLLNLYRTPANQRLDITTNPDIYNQSTASDMGMLLEDIYQCSRLNGGTLLAVFPDEIDQSKCQQMVSYLTRNRIGTLIQSGVPEGAVVAHKYGWETPAGIMVTLGDAAIVSTAGGDYVLVIFLYHPIQLVWDPVSKLVTDLSAVIYNYFNLPVQ
jgi:beta-lactamase class A